MSHFTVLVAVPEGKTLEDVLLPYHEFECTGIDAYIQDVDITEKVLSEEGSLEEKLEYYGLEDRTVTDESLVDTIKTHKYGYAVVKDGALVKAVDRTNPNSKWDWYSIGGRWTGALKLKPTEALALRGRDEVAGLNRNEVDFLVTLYKSNRDKFEQTIKKYDGKSDEIRVHVEQIINPKRGGRPKGARNGTPGVMTSPNTDDLRADIAYAKDVDWESMSDDDTRSAEDRWDNFAEVLALAGATPEQFLEADGDGKRDMFHKTGLDFSDERYEKASWFEPLGNTREEHVAKASARAHSFAFIDLEGKWIERGNMGWWAIVTNENDNYDEAWWKFVRSLPENQMIYMVDCHI